MQLASAKKLPECFKNVRAVTPVVPHTHHDLTAYPESGVLW